MSVEPILSLEGITKKFGGVTIVNDLSFSIRKASRTALIGPNGAGKTSVFNLITGVYLPTEGRVSLLGEDITDMPSRTRVAKGVARTFQNVRLVPQLTVLENVVLGQCGENAKWFGALQPINLRKSNRWFEDANFLLQRFGLEKCRHAAAGALPYGTQRSVEIVRALISRPKMLLLDEPAAGLNAAETEALESKLTQYCESEALTLLIVEHDMHFIGRLCDAAVVLNFGSKIAEGSPTEIKGNPDVREIYLGRTEDAGLTLKKRRERVASGE